MSEITLGVDLLVIICFSFVLGFIAIKAKEPVIIGYLIAGIIAGGSVLNIIKSAEIIEVLAEIGIALMLFHVGIEFSFHSLKKKRDLVIFGGIGQLLLTSLVLFIVFNLLNRFIDASPYSVLFMSMVFSFSSTAVVMKMLSDAKLMAVHSSKIMTAWLVIQDLAFIPLSIILLSIGKGSENLFLDVLIAIVKALLVMGISLGILKKVIYSVFEKVAAEQSRELLLLASLAYSLGLAFVTQQLGISFVLGAFIAGLTLSGTSFYTRLYTEIRSLKDIFTLLFFFSIGALLDLKEVWKYLPTILLIVVIVVFVKLLVSFLVAKVFKAHTKTAVNIGLGIFQIGEFSFVLGKLALDQNVLDQKTYSIILAAAILSIIITPLFIFRGNDIYQFFRELTRKNFRFIYEKIFLEKIDVKDDFSEVQNHVIICGYGRIGRAVGEALLAQNIEIVVVDENETVINELKERRVSAVFGDSVDLEVLEKADAEKAQTIIIALPTLLEVIATAESAKMLNENIEIIARSEDIKSSTRLTELGAEMIIEPEFETAKKIVSEMLPKLGKGYKRAVQKMEKTQSDEIDG